MKDTGTLKVSLPTEREDASSTAEIRGMGKGAGLP
jgi:hypothetical protein